MTEKRTLTELVTRQVKARGDHVAVRAADGALTYAELDALADRLSAEMKRRGLAEGDRVGIWLEKSAAAVATMQAVLRAGGVYVPVDPLSPPARARAILDDCAVRLVVTNADREKQLADAGTACNDVVVLERGDRWTESVPVAAPAAAGEPPPASARGGDDLAYVLYTSGSTGTPKGVCLSHENARAFVDWAVEAIGARPDDRFANHASFHFDLSVLDIYGAFAVGATVCVLPEGAAYQPKKMVAFVHDEKITVWYSVPSALMLMMERGDLLEAGVGALRVIVFAGEPFPPRSLSALQAKCEGVRLFNFYGPTETNVCTAWEVTRAIDPEGAPIPIGTAASGDRVWALKEDGAVAGPGESGELVVEGPTVMRGYWGQPPPALPYRTGDMVTLRDDGDFDYQGRRDQMVKVRGHRIDLGEVEHALRKHAHVRDVAVVCVGSSLGARLVAVVLAEGAEPSLLDVKRHCSTLVPTHMIPDRVVCVPELPLTRNGKVDRARLSELVASRS